MDREIEQAIVIGAGPAGLTAAYEFLEQTGVRPVVFESSQELGGISRTVVYKGNRLDIGGHRFFSKSDWVMNWWAKFLPVQPTGSQQPLSFAYRGARRELPASIQGTAVSNSEQVMLVRKRRSRILYRGKFFGYPVKLDWTTLRNLGVWTSLKIGLSYVAARLRPLPEASLQEFYINRFGRELYETFFRDYTEKVWGIPCSQISPEWGAQRVKGLSVSKALLNALRSGWRRGDLAQKGLETSLIEHFLYPKYGPGQMWEAVARQVVAKGGSVTTGQRVTRVHAGSGRIQAVTVRDLESGRERRVSGQHFLSTMPVSELIAALEGVDIPEDVRRIASGLPFRDFLTVGLLVKQLKMEAAGDHWIYIQESRVKLGRLQIFNNWSPHMVSEGGKLWLGLEYFLREGDELWNLPDADMTGLAIAELVSIGLLRPEDVLDSTVVRVKKAYPAYSGTYSEFATVRRFLSQFPNLYLIGRNGMHRYNNQDHSMLTALAAVENVRSGRADKTNIWEINAEDDYHEAVVTSARSPGERVG